MNLRYLQKTQIIQKLQFHLILAVSLSSFATVCPAQELFSKGYPVPAKFENVYIAGELQKRVLKNFDRLEENKYQPDQVFLSEEASGGWPGDTEGRTILGLVMDAQASHRKPVYLEEIIRRIPAHLNEAGYMGTIYPNKMNEQQLSGNGWMLRGLCEYYSWTGDKKALQIISSISRNLFVKGKGFYAHYPIDPVSREKNVGAESGSIQKVENDWMLSSDIGCLFIGMDGAIQAYQYLRIPELKVVIEEMIDRFLEIDLMAIKAQTHASLTACRGLIRYADITGEKRFLEEAEKRWAIYKSVGMTENFENYNWFNRYDTWTEPCAIVDSYLLAVQLWQHTLKPEYYEDAELIYYNAICHTQRNNGGFGCDNCPGKQMDDVFLRIHANEAHWCCTMRGGEGLGCAVRYACFTKQDTLFIPFYHEGRFSLPLKKRTSVFTLVQKTNYPFEGKVRLEIKQNTAGSVTLKMASPSWTGNQRLSINGHSQPIKTEQGFVTLTREFKAGDVVELLFDERLAQVTTINLNNTDSDQLRVFYGPLLLGSEAEQMVRIKKDDTIIPFENGTFKVLNKEIYLTPVYHLMDSKVWGKAGYKKQILF